MDRLIKAWNNGKFDRRLATPANVILDVSSMADPARRMMPPRDSRFVNEAELMSGKLF